MIDIENIQHFFEHGFVILKGCIEKEECQRYLREVIEPVVDKFSINLNDPESWKLENTGAFVTDEGSVEEVPFGIMLRNIDGTDPIDHPVEKEWPAVMSSKKLIQFLDYLHGCKKNWRWLHSENIGWIHMRFPITKDDTDFRPSWHVDGGHFQLHRLDSLEQSCIVLPMIQDVNENGGNTLVIPGSHHKIMKHLKDAEGKHYHDLKRISEEMASNLNENEVVTTSPCHAGDILVLHPFVVHAASGNFVDNITRITFNLGTRWREDYPLLDHKSDHKLSALEVDIINECNKILK